MADSGVYYGRSSQMTEERMRDAAEKQAKQRALREDLEAQMHERRRVLEATGITPLSTDVPIGTANINSGMTKAQRRRQQMMQERQALSSAPTNEPAFAGVGGHPYAAQHPPGTAGFPAGQAPHVAAPSWGAPTASSYQPPPTAGSYGAPQGDESVYSWAGAAPSRAAQQHPPPPTAPLRPSPPLPRAPAPGQPPVSPLSPRGVALPSVYATPPAAPAMPPAALTQEQLMQLLARATDQIYESRLGTAPQPAGAPHDGGGNISPTQRDVESRRVKRDVSSRAKSRERGGTASEDPQARQKVQRLTTDLVKHQQAMDKLQEQAKDWEQEVSQLRQQLKNAKLKEKELQKIVQAKQPKTASGPHHRAETAPNNLAKGSQRRVQLDPLAAQDESGAHHNRPITAPQSTSPVPAPTVGARPTQHGRPQATSSALPALVVPSVATTTQDKFAQKKWLASPRDPPPPKTAGTVVVASPTAAAPGSPTKGKPPKAQKAPAPPVPSHSADDDDGDSPMSSSGLAVAVSLTRLAQFATVDQIITHAQANLLWSHFAARMAKPKKVRTAAVNGGHHDEDAQPLNTYETFEELCGDDDAE